MAIDPDLKLLQDRRKEQKNLLNEMLEGKTEEQRITLKQTAEYKQQVNILREINEQVKEIASENKIRVDNLIQQESKLKGLSGIQASLVQSDRERIELQQSLSSEVQTSINDISSLNNDLLALSSEDSIARALTIDQINEQIEGIIEQRGEISKSIEKLKDRQRIGEDVTTELEKQQKLLTEYEKTIDQIIPILNEQRSISERMSSLSEGQQEQLNAQFEVYNSIKKTVSGVLDTVGLLASKSGVGLVVIGLGQAVGKIGEVNQQLGISLFTTDGIGRNTALMNVFFDDAVGTTQELANQFGSTEAASLQTQFNTNLLAKNLGISGKETAQLVGSFARLNNGSTSVANDLIVSTKELAKQRGVIPSQVMEDLANNTEAFALYAKDGGKNILQASVFAKQLGTDMSTLVGITDNLLDFESSITKELELSAMLGRNINLNKARQLAYDGDIEEATRETLRQLGGIDEFNRMDVFQKRSAAELLGVSVAQLQQMVELEGKANTEVSFMTKQYDKLNELSTALSNTMGGPFLTTLGSGLVALGQISGGIQNIISLEKIKARWAKITSFFRKKETAEIIAQEKIKSAGRARDSMGRFTSAIPSTTTKTSPIGSAGKAASGGISGMNPASMLKGAAAILILSGAMFVAAKAFQEFGDVTWESVAMGITSIGALALIAMALGKVTPLILKGAAAIAILGAGLIPLAFALKLASPGIEAFGNVISSVFVAVGETISKLITSIGEFVVNISSIASPQMVVSILGLAGAFTTLSASLAVFALAGLAALPAITALSLFSKITSTPIKLSTEAVSTDTESMKKTDELIQEIRGLRKDLNDGKVAVYMDGRKVTASVSRVVDRMGTNMYG